MDRQSAPYQRSESEVLSSTVWPKSAPDDKESQRHAAVADVLRRLPEADYRLLLEQSGRFRWFIPHWAEYGRVHRFRATDAASRPDPSGTPEPSARVFYLSATLERASWPVAVAVVAHGLAHIVLDHEPEVDAGAREAQDEAAWRLVVGWGFASPTALHRAWPRRRSGRRTNRPRG